MTPVQTATRERNANRDGPARRHPPADVLFAPDKDARREIVVDWQLPSDTNAERN